MCIYMYIIYNSSGNVAYHAQVTRGTRPITIAAVNNESATMKQDVSGVYYKLKGDSQCYMYKCIAISEGVRSISLSHTCAADDAWYWLKRVLRIG